MLGWRPSVIYKYLWKYVCLLAMVGLLAASLIRMFIARPTYMAWNQEKVRSSLASWKNDVISFIFILFLNLNLNYIPNVLEGQGIKKTWGLVYGVENKFGLLF